MEDSMHKDLKCPYTAVRCAVVAFAVLLVLPGAARADTWVLWDWSAYIDGDTFNPPGLPATVNSAGFDFAAGLGTMTMQFAPGAHRAGIYLAHYYDSGFGDVTDGYADGYGILPAGVTWEAGWPGIGLVTVFDRMIGDALLNASSVTTYAPPPDPTTTDPPICCDVALALMRSFDVPDGYTGHLTYTVGAASPGASFYLKETDHDSGASIYLSDDFHLTSDTPGVPEPAAVWLLLTAAAGAFWARRRRA
jgi:hypothetical protein